MKVSPLLLVGLTGLLCSCGSSRGTGQPTYLSQAQRYDPTTRSWVSATTPTVLPATVAPQSLPPEKTSDTVKVLNASSGVPAPAAAAPPVEENPGLFKRVGRAATSPLRWVGIGDNPS